MPDYPEAILDEAATAIHDANCGDPACDSDSCRSCARNDARLALAAAAPLFANAVAERIIAFADEHAPKGDHVPSARRRAFMTAAQVASRAFTTREEDLRQVAEALGRGDFACCDAAPEPVTPAPQSTEGPEE